MITRPCRPLWTMGVAWAVTCLIGAWLPTWWIVCAAITATVCFGAAMVIQPLRDRRDVLLILATVAVAAVVLWHVDVLRYQPVMQAVDTEVSFSAVVLTDAARPTVRVLSGDLPSGTTVRLIARNVPYTLQPNDVIKDTFLLKSLDASGWNPFQIKASGVWCSATPISEGVLTPIGHQAPAVWVRLSAWREMVAATMQRVLPGDVGAVLSGICLGEDTTLSAQATEQFRACGISHLFAVSGLHLAVLTSALLKFLHAVRIPRRLRGALGAVAVLGFMLLMDAAASVTRAGVMCLLVMLGECFQRQADARNSMGLALLLLLVGDPFAIYDAGLLLSFLATCGILFLSPHIQQGMMNVPMPKVLSDVWKTFSSTVSVTVSACVMTLPVTVLYFGSVSIIGVLVNPIVTLPAMAELVLGWVAVLPITLGLEWIYRPLLLILGLLSRVILWITEWAASLPFSVFTVPLLSMTT